MPFIVPALVSSSMRFSGLRAESGQVDSWREQERSGQKRREAEFQQEQQQETEAPACRAK